MKLQLLPDKLLGELRMLPLLDDVFKATALAMAYDNMITIMQKSLRSHPEVRKVPALLDLLVEHFVTFKEEHISIEHSRIFNDSYVGSGNTLRSWQEAGYRTRRTRANYARRLERWKAIWDEKDLLVSIKKKNPKGEVVERRRRTFLGMATERKINLGRVRNKDGTVITYPLVIQLRNANFAEIHRVPWWIPFNYGTRGAIMGGGSGYPNVPGAHFIDKAELQKELYLRRAIGWYEEFCVRVLDGKSEANYSGANSFLKRHARGKHIDILETAMSAVANEF